MATAQAASAEGGWQVESRASDASPVFTDLYVYSSSINATHARLRVRASRRMRVTVQTSITCWSTDYTVHASRELSPSRRWVTPRRPLVRVYAALGPETPGCSFSSSVFGTRGRLSATLETQGSTPL
ncbi:MAG TPA: hypothetical protein VH834_18260 [Solirubrobacteraceae bacterium]|jgi:hypothetical protein